MSASQPQLQANRQRLRQAPGGLHAELRHASNQALSTAEDEATSAQDQDVDQAVAATLSHAGSVRRALDAVGSDLSSIECLVLPILQENASQLERLYDSLDALETHVLPEVTAALDRMDESISQLEQQNPSSAQNSIARMVNSFKAWGHGGGDGSADAVPPHQTTGAAGVPWEPPQLFDTARVLNKAAAEAAAAAATKPSNDLLGVEVDDNFSSTVAASLEHMHVPACDLPHTSGGPQPRTPPRPPNVVIHDPFASSSGELLVPESAPPTTPPKGQGAGGYEILGPSPSFSTAQGLSAPDYGRQSSGGSGGGNGGNTGGGRQVGIGEAMDPEMSLRDAPL